MKILVVDIGTGTQDILLADTKMDIENSFRMIVPSPTMIANRKIKTATKAGSDIAISGVMMGGGPSFWAAKEHIKQGYRIFSTKDAAKTFDDDLDKVRELGVGIISNDELDKLSRDIIQIKFMDFDYRAISEALNQFSVDIEEINAISVGVFDHGNAPPNYSDRQFRFDYLIKKLKEDPRIGNFAFRNDSIPMGMTRIEAVAKSTGILKVPAVLMDTAPAAVLGATFDKQLDSKKDKLIVNIGNMHTIAFILTGEKVVSVFEHHTGELSSDQLESIINKFARNELSHSDVFDHHGHGALSLEEYEYDLENGEIQLVVTGPRQNMIRKTGLSPIYAAPFGDMMLTGCYGLLAAAGKLLPKYSNEIQQLLTSSNKLRSAPWDI